MTIEPKEVNLQDAAGMQLVKILRKIVDWINNSGGGGGSNDYDDLDNKPSINSVELTGNKTASDLGLVDETDLETALDEKADAITEVTVSTDGSVTQALDAGKIYHFTGALTGLTITLNTPADGGVAQYHFVFVSGSPAPTLTLPNTVSMPTGFSVGANNRYEIDILDGYGVVSVWAAS